ncbi:MAG: hypothetical protein KDI56_15645 [Xanthomonadales bacterium]|nr:hypothetical protein [Xanthomonadales bacterium]
MVRGARPGADYGPIQTVASILSLAGTPSTFEPEFPFGEPAMKTRASRILAMFACFQLASADAKAISTEQCTDHFNHLLEIDLTSATEVDRDALGDRLMAAQLAFQKGFDHADDISTDCRVVQFRSLQMVNFYAQSEASLNMLRGALSDLEALGVADEQHRAFFYQALVGQRRFEEARAFKRQYPMPEVEDIPDIAKVDFDHPVAYGIDESGSQLVPLSMDLSEIRLVAVVHPACAFSRRAMTAIASAQPEVAAGRAVYLMPVDHRLYLSELTEWNTAHASMQIVLANSRDDWPFIDRWGTPTFYVLKDGQVQERLTGWPDDSQLDELVRLVERVD